MTDALTGGGLKELGRDLKAAGAADLRKDLLAGIRAAAKPVTVAAPESAMSTLPKAGGLNAFVASARFTVRTRLTGTGAGTKLTGTQGNHDINALDGGNARHPVYGHRKVWVSQSVTPGWFTNAVAKSVPAVREALVIVADGVRARIIRP